jgi:transcriptional regulator with XRE-family HTH domain
MKLSLREIARITGISASTISRIENGQFSPTLDNAIKLATALNIVFPCPDKPADLVTCTAPRSNVPAPQPVGPSTNAVSYSRIEITIVKAGIRRNLSKIASRGSYEKAVLLRGTIQLRANNGFREKLTPGATINCEIIAKHTFFAIAAEEAELLWVG